MMASTVSSMRSQWAGSAGTEPVANQREPQARLYARPDAPVRDERPPTDVEFVVRGVWQEMFGFEHIGLAENFFDLGGHSLLAVRINSELRALFRMELALAVQFRHPTVEGLAAAVVEAGRAQGSDAAAVAATLREVSEMSEEDLLALLDGEPAGAA